MGARLYNPTTGRFLQVDPVSSGSANDYDYCNGDPINCTDLDGRCPFCFLIPAGVGWVASRFTRGQAVMARRGGPPTGTMARRVGRPPGVIARRVAPGTKIHRNSNAYGGPSWGYRIMYTNKRGKLDVYKWGITSVPNGWSRANASRRQCAREGHKHCYVAQVRTFKTRLAARQWEFFNCTAYVFAFGRRPVGMKTSCR